jgi:FkbM family methyltransferase
MQALNLLSNFDPVVGGIIHVGASVGQECSDYYASGAQPCVYIEPIAEIFDILERNVSNFPGHVAIKALCSDSEGEEVVFNVASNGGQSSSMLAFGEHAKIYPNIKYIDARRMRTRTLDSIVAERFADVDFSLLVIDTQGADLKVLRGAVSLLSRIDAVFVEVSEQALYEGGCTHEEVTAFLGDNGFQMKWMSIGPDGWGDAFYLTRRPLVKAQGPDLPAPSRNLALGRPASQSSRSEYSRPDDPQGAVNGVRNGQFGFHTAFEESPWWQVDLGEVMPIGEIRIYNRVDQEAARARTLIVLVSDDNVAWRCIHRQEGRPFGGVKRGPLRVLPERTAARFVRLQLQERQYLHLDEVEVYGPVA